MPSVEGVKISQLPQATTADGSDVLAGVQYGTTKRFPLSVLIAWIKSHIGLTAADVGAQPTITASGILKGDGLGGVSAATAGTDYATPAQLADKAAKADLTSIQATGTTNTTGAAIPAEALFYLNGILYRAKTQIDVNATFTTGTNCEPTTVGDEFGNLYTIDGTSVSATANTDTNISITAPNGYRYGVFVGFAASSDYTKITLITVAAQGANYPNRIRFRSTVAQTVTARVLWFK